MENELEMEGKMQWHIIAVGAYRVLVAIALLAGVIAGDLSIERAAECLGVGPAQAASSSRSSEHRVPACLSLP